MGSDQLDVSVNTQDGLDDRVVDRVEIAVFALSSKLLIASIVARSQFFTARLVRVG